MDRFKIPAKWSKKDFTWATFCARMDKDVDVRLVAIDLECCVEFGFTWARECGFRVNYAKYRESVESRSCI